MSSTIKTPVLNLNNWIGSDIPKREDFNNDNIKIDEICGEHTTDRQIHITLEERKRWNSQCVTGMYFGSGESEKTIDLGFKPKAAIAFTYHKPIETTSAECYSGIATQYLSTIGIDLTETGFKVYFGSPHDVDGIKPKLNAMGLDYSYIALK